MRRPRARRLRRLLRFALVALALLLLAPLGLVAGVLQTLQTPRGRDFARARAVAAVRELAIPGLEVAHLGGAPPWELVLGGIVLRDPEGRPAVQVDAVYLSLAPRLSSRITVRRLLLLRPRVEIRTLADGSLNLARLVKPSERPPEPSGPATLELDLERLTLVGGELRAESPGGAVLVHDLELSARLGLRGEDVSVELEKLVLGARAPGLPPLALALETRASLTRGALDAGLRIRADGLLPLDGPRTGAEPIVLRAAARGPLARRLDLELDLRLPREGALRLSGHVGFPLRYGLHLALSGVDPSVVQRSLPAARLAAELRLDGAGIPLEPGSRARFSLAARPLEILGIPVQSLALAGSLDGRHASLQSAHAALPGLSLAASGRADLARRTLEGKAAVTLAGRLPARLGGVEGRARIDASARGSFAPRGSLAAEARIRAARVARAGLVLLGLDAKLAARGLPASPTGSFELRATRLTPAPGSPPLEAIAFAGSATPERIQLRGGARGRGVGARLRVDTRLARDGGVRVQLEELALAHPLLTVLLRAPTQVSIRPRPLAVDLSRTRIGLLGGQLSVEGRLRATGAERLHARFDARALTLPRLGPLSASGAVRWGARQLHAELDAAVGPGRRPLRVRATLPLRAARGPLPPPAPRGPVELSLGADALELAWLARASGRPLPLRGRLDLSAEVRGRLEDPRGELRLQVADGHYGEIVSALGLTVQAKTDGTESSLSVDARERGQALLAASARVRAGPLALAALGARPRDLEAVPLEASLRVPALALARLGPFSPALKGLPGRATLELGARGSAARPRLELRVSGDGLGRTLRHLGVAEARRLGSVALRVLVDGERDATRAVVALDLARARFLDASAELAAAPLTLARARPFASLPVRARLRVPSFALERLAPSADAFGVRGLRGQLAASAELTGSLAHPAGRAELSLASAGALGAHLDRVRLTASLAEPRGLRADLELAPNRNGALRAGLAAPVAALRCRPSPRVPCPPLAATLQIDRLELGTLAPFAPGLRRLAGQLDARLETELRLGALPRARGFITLSEGAVSLPARPPLEGIALKLRIEPARVILEELRVPSGKGKLVARASASLGADLRPERFELAAEADGLPLALAGVDGVRLDARAALAGSLAPDRGLEAELRLERGVVRIDKLPGGGRALHEAGPLPEVRFVQSLDEPRARVRDATRVSAAPGTPPLPIRARATIRSLLIRGKEVNTEVSGEATLATNRRGQLTLAGGFLATGGRIEILKRQYEIDRVRISFDGSELARLDPRVDVLISRRFPGATAIVAVTGSASAPELKLRSEPPIYDSSQVLALVLTGQPDVAQGGAGSSLSVASLVLQAAVGWMLEKISPVLALDVIRLDQVGSGTRGAGGEQEQSTRLEVGRYVTDRIYLGYRHIFNTPEGKNANEGRVEWRIAPRWSLEAAFGDAGAGGLDLFWTYWY